LKKIVFLLMGIVVVVFLATMIFINKINSEVEKTVIEDIKIENIEDGIYEGEYSISPVTANVRVIINNGKIGNIEILKHDNLLGEKAERITDQVVEKSSLKVDIVTGATASSKTILKAIENALLNGI